MLAYLWRHRESPMLLSRRWFVVWIKRTLSAPALAMLLCRRLRLRIRGAEVGDRAIIERCNAEGRLALLHIGESAFVGRDTEFALHDHIHIGRSAVINRRVTILTASHSLRDELWRMYSKPVVIGEQAWIATGATILPGVTIGRGAVVGAGAVVRQDVPAGAVAVGNPAIITTGVRGELLAYDTARFAAPLEAWLGPQRLTPSRTTCEAER